MTIVEKDNGAVTSTKNFLSIGSEICEERDGSNNVTKRFYVQGMQIGAANYYYSRDHLGSVRELTDSFDAVQARYDYDPYGRRSKISGGLEADFGFTGHYWHSASGLHLALYRGYDGNLGRWLSRDPIAELGGLNLYGYTYNDPLNLVDPLGLDSWYNVVGDWFFERGSTGGSSANRRHYDLSHQVTRDLVHDTGVERARAAWDAAGRPNSFSYNYGFGVGDYFRELFTLDGTGSALGSYQVNIIICPDGSTRFVIQNTTGWESGTRSPIPRARRNPSIEDMFNGASFTPNPRSILNDRPRGASGPGGNFYQTYYWHE